MRPNVFFEVSAVRIFLYHSFGLDLIVPGLVGAFHVICQSLAVTILAKQRIRLA